VGLLPRRHDCVYRESAQLYRWSRPGGNGNELIAPEPEPFIMMTRLASGEIDEIELAEWIRVNLSPLLD
jgi:hypothetical protein